MDDCQPTFAHLWTNVLEYYSALRKEEVLSFATTWINREGIMLSEMSDRERQMLHDVICMWNFKKLNSSKQRVEWWLPGVGL